MHKFKVTVALLAACLSLHFAVAAKAETYFPVVPGKSVGKVKLGDTRSTVTKNLGKPTQTVKWKSGPTQDTWWGPVPANDKNGDPVAERTFLIVIYKSDKVVQIEFNSPKFKTAAGITTASSLAQFRDKHPNPQVKGYIYADPEGGGYNGYYYDDVKKGLTFTLGCQDYFDARITPYSLRVYGPNTPVLPDPGGKATKADMEIPVGPA